MKIIKVAVLCCLPILSGCSKKDTKPEESKLDYTNFKILQVKITAMPFLDANSTSWDILNGPDVFFNIEDVNNKVLYNGSSSRINDLSTNGLPVAWNFVNAYQITNLNVTHFVTVYDYDSPDPDDLIGYVGFTLKDHKNGYPKSVTKSSGALTIVITGEWY